MPTNPWTYESFAEKKQRELSEFDAVANGGRNAFTSPDPLAPTRAAQTSTEWGQRLDGNGVSERTAAIRADIAKRAQENLRGPASRALGALGTAFSELDRPLSERAGIAIPDLPGPLDEIGNFALREFTRPTNLLTALAGGPETTVALRGSGILGRIAAGAVEPVIAGGLASRVASGALVNGGARILADTATEALPDDTPDALKAIVSLGAGAIGGIGTAAGLRGLSRAAGRAAANGASAITRLPSEATATEARYLNAAGDEALPDVADALHRATLTREADAPSYLSRLLYELPGTKSTLRPGLNMPDHVLDANIARDATSASFEQQAFATRRPIYSAIDEAFGKGATNGSKVGVVFNGPEVQLQYPAAGTLKDIFERPQMYELNPAQQAVIDAYHQRNEVERQAAKRFGVDIGEFSPGDGAAYLPNIDASESVDTWLKNLEGTNGPAKLAGSSAKAREYTTGFDHWKADIESVANNRITPEQVFVPQTNLRVLTEGLDAQKSRMAGDSVFRAGIGGKTPRELAEELTPSLVKTREALQSEVAAVRGKQQRAIAAVTRDEALARRFAGAATQTENRADSLMARMGSGADPTLDRLVGGIDELDRVGNQLSAVSDTAAGRAALREAGFGNLQQEMGDLKDRLKSVNASYQNINPLDNVLVTEVGGKYFPSAEAGHIKRLLQRDAHPITKALASLNATVLGGDLSPIVGQQGQIQWLTAPVQTTQMVAGALKNGWEQGDLLRAFRADDLASDISQNAQTWGEFAQATGRSFTPGSVPEEFAGGLFRKLPGGVGDKFARFNDAVFTATVRGQKQMFDDTVADLVRTGLSREQAVATAGQHVMEIIPTPNAAAAGLSPKQAELLRTPFTSTTFIQRPMQTISDAGEAFFKMATGQGGAVTPRQQLALKASVRMAGTALGLAASTSAVEALRTGGDPVKAAEDAINPDPKNSKFMTLTFPGGVRIPLGGPYRALIRAIAPGEVKLAGVDDPVYLPFAGAPAYFGNRVSPALGLSRDLIRNKDFYGSEIISGDFPANILKGAAYVGAGTLPLTAQAPYQAARRGDSIGQGALEALGGALGTNISPQSPSTQLDTIANSRFGKNFYDLEPVQRATIKNDHPDIWSEAVRRGGTDRQLAEAVKAELHDQQSADDDLLLKGQVTREDWKTERDRRRIELRSKLEQIYGDDPVTDAAAAKDPMLHFVQAIQQATDQRTGRVNWDAVDEQRAQFSEQENAFIDRNTGVGDTPVQRLYRDISKDYYDLPQYNGFTAQEGRDINDVWSAVRNLAATNVQPGQQPSAAQLAVAFRRLTSQEELPANVSLGVQRRILGTLTESKARERYRLKTPAAALVVGTGPLNEKQSAAIEMALGR